VSVHSPEPWCLVYSDEHENWSVRRLGVANPGVAIVWTEADARLIAAAPELLAELRLAEATHPISPLSSRWRALIARIEAGS
jgi:hypothetical protein